ncbi:hypothetical protein AMECASPLE_037758, partial [Ameca splendens]
DLLYVISYGPSQVKPPAVQMLFHYWPNLKPPGAISEYRGLQYTAWNPIHCQHIECHNAINKPAVKMCIDPTLSVALGDKPPPLYLCQECSQRIAGYASASPLFSKPNAPSLETHISCCPPQCSCLQCSPNTKPWLCNSPVPLMRLSSEKCTCACFSFLQNVVIIILWLCSVLEDV